jgi:pyruvate/2-oxoglutarate/acetoin dehydrogenase E1 component/TPP-dependent pyruvate/acetoin dehydrogenase alpha subunit
MSAHPIPDLPRLYRSLRRIRRAEEEVARIYPTDKIKSPVHLSIGQEAVSSGVCEALRKDDIVFGTYRGHALFLAKGGTMRQMIAELFGKVTGCARGKGGSMHLVDAPNGMMGTSAVVATTIPEAVGYAYALKQKKSDAIVVSFFGDGAVEEGAFYESLNFAALKQLPILFVCENNNYAIHTHQRQRQHKANICDLAAPHGIPAERIENNDSLRIFQRVSEVAAKMRRGESGPVLLECMTYRWREHVGPGEDFHLGYRTTEEARAWIEADELNRIGGKLPAAQRAQIDAEVEAELRDALDFAEKSPFPDPSELWLHTYKDSTPATTAAPTQSDREASFVDAIREGFEAELQRDPSVVVFGLDVDDPKAILGTTKGLPQKFGADRVFGTPLSEDGLTGAAIGMALAGLRPVHVHIRMDFLTLAMNQLLNMAAKSRYMFGGQVNVPLVVRAMIGRSWGQGAQHSQALHSFFMHTPGIKVVAPATPYDAKGCLIAAIQDDNPVLFVEHRLLHYLKGPVPAEPYAVLPGKARITAHGDDVTLVGISYMQLECLRAHRYLETVGIHAEVIDPIWLSPLDMDTIIASVRRTKRLVVVDNGWTTCGAAAEIAARVAEALEGDPQVRIRRMGFAPVTCPTSPTLEAHFYPNPRNITSMAYNLVRGGQTDWLPEERKDLQAVEFKGPF